MAIKKQITFEGNTYYLGNKDRVSAEAAHQDARRPGEIQFVSTAEESTIGAHIGLVDLSVDGAYTLNMPKAVAGRHIKVFWSVEQATGDRVFTRAGSDTFAGNIFTTVAGNAAGDGDVVAIANTTVTITTVDDVNIGSYLDFHCSSDGTWLTSGHLVVDAVGNVPTLA